MKTLEENFLLLTQFLSENDTNDFYNINCTPYDIGLHTRKEHKSKYESIGFVFSNVIDADYMRGTSEKYPNFRIII